MKMLPLPACILGLVFAVAGCGSIPLATPEQQKHEITIRFYDFTTITAYDCVLNGIRKDPFCADGIVVKEKEPGKIIVNGSTPFAVTGPDGAMYDLRFTMSASLTDSVGTFTFTHVDGSRNSISTDHAPADRDLRDLAWFHRQARTAFYRWIGEILRAGSPEKLTSNGK
jgi:hypothetical protein